MVQRGLFYEDSEYFLWFYFEVNLDATLLTVHVVVKRDNRWTLMGIYNTNQWKSWITEATGHGRAFGIVIQFTEKSQVPPVVAETEEQSIA
jgi:hypothetical protein